jgi:hypothetical protein
MTGKSDAVHLSGPAHRIPESELGRPAKILFYLTENKVISNKNRVA